MGGWVNDWCIIQVRVRVGCEGGAADSDYSTNNKAWRKTKKWMDECMNGDLKQRPFGLTDLPHCPLHYPMRKHLVLSNMRKTHTSTVEYGIENWRECLRSILYYHIRVNNTNRVECGIENWRECERGILYYRIWVRNMELRRVWEASCTIIFE